MAHEPPSITCFSIRNDMNTCGYVLRKQIRVFVKVTRLCANLRLLVRGVKHRVFRKLDLTPPRIRGLIGRASLQSTRKPESVWTGVLSDTQGGHQQEHERQRCCRPHHRRSSSRLIRHSNICWIFRERSELPFQRSELPVTINSGQRWKSLDS